MAGPFYAPLDSQCQTDGGVGAAAVPTLPRDGTWITVCLGTPVDVAIWIVSLQVQAALEAIYPDGYGT